MASSIDEGLDIDMEKGLMTPSSSQNPFAEPSPSPSPSSSTAPALVLSNSGKRIDQAGKKKYVKQVTGRHNDTELHLAAQRGDLAAVKQILDDIDSQMVGTLSGADFDAEVAEIRASVVNEVNVLGVTALHKAAENGHLDVVKELLKYSTKETLSLKNQVELDPLHIAASQGHHAIVQVLLEHDPTLSQTRARANATPLITAATKGHMEVVRELLSKDRSLLEIAKANGKNALHLAARSGHVEIVKALLEKDPQLARRTDKKGQTALHMAVKGTSSEVVKLLLEADPAIVMLPDKSGKTALHVATRKKRPEIVNELLCLPDTSANVNALTRDHKTALDIAEGLPLSEELSEIKSCLMRCGAVRANELNQPRDELRNTVTQIKMDVHTQLLQTKKTNKNVHGIAKELRKLHREGINNATNSVTLVAVLFATVAFAAIFTVPGGDDSNGMAVVSKPEAAEWKTKTINKYEDLEELFGKDRANGQGAETAKEKKRRWAKTKANSVCGDNVETIDDIDFRISRDEYNLEGFSVDLEGDDVEILPDGKAFKVPSQSVSYSKGKRKKTETMKEIMKTSLDKISNAIERSTDAILESSASIAKFRSRVISSEEITEELEKMGVEGKFFDDAFELLTDNPEKAKKLFGYPKKGRFEYLEKLVYQI